MSLCIEDVILFSLSKGEFCCVFICFSSFLIYTYIHKCYCCCRLATIIKCIPSVCCRIKNATITTTTYQSSIYCEMRHYRTSFIMTQNGIAVYPFILWHLIPLTQTRNMNCSYIDALTHTHTERFYAIEYHILYLPIMSHPFLAITVLGQSIYHVLLARSLPAHFTAFHFRYFPLLNRSLLFATETQTNC